MVVLAPQAVLDNEPNQSANPSVMLAEEWLVAPVLYIFEASGSSSWPETNSRKGKKPQTEILLLTYCAR